MDALLRRRAMIGAGGGPTPPLPYTPVEYIETDGVAYIDTGITGVPSKSAEIKVLPIEGSVVAVLLLTARQRS